jgi:hypothetical protein
MDDRRRAVRTGIAAMRLGYGTLMVLAPRRMLRLQLGGEPAGAIVWLAQAVGVRDAVLGAGVLLAPDKDTRSGWVAAGAVVDGIDALTAIAGGRWLGRGRATAVAALGVGAAAAAAWSLRDR